MPRRCYTVPSTVLLGTSPAPALDQAAMQVLPIFFVCFWKPVGGPVWAPKIFFIFCSFCQAWHSGWPSVLLNLGWVIAGKVAGDEEYSSTYIYDVNT